MNANLRCKVMSVLVVVVMLVSSVSGARATLAGDTVAVPSRCEVNKAVLPAGADGALCATKTTKGDCDQFAFCWWRDASAQNALWQHTADEFTGTVTKVYEDYPDLTVMLYSSLNGPSVVAIVGPSEMVLVGAGGSREGAIYAKNAFQKAYSGFTGKDLKGIILPTADQESSWGVWYWRSFFEFYHYVPQIISASYESARQNRDMVQKELDQRRDMAYGTTTTNTPTRMIAQTLPWGPDAFLGTGSMRQYLPKMPGIAAITTNDIFIDTPYEVITVNGMPVVLFPTTEEDGGLLVYVKPGLTPCDAWPSGCFFDEDGNPNPGGIALIAPDMGTYLPDVGSIVGPSPRVADTMAALDMMRGLHAQSLVPLNGLPIANDAAAVNTALTAQRDALSYIRSETLKLIGYDFTLEDIMATVHLPATLANSPYNQPFVSLTQWIVRSLYHDYLGWFDGNPAHLESLSTAETASREMAFGGGERQVLAYIKSCLSEHSRSGAVAALDKLTMLRRIYPSAQADAYYVQALKMLAWTTKSAQLRNYYLSLVQEIQPVLPGDFQMVFVTNGAYTGNLGGLAGADAKCQAAATAAGLPGAYKAWLSDSTTSAADRMSHSSVLYMRPDGIPVANNWGDLTDGTLIQPISVNEYGTTTAQAPVEAWTATMPAGLSDGPDFCGNWTVGDDSASGGSGSIRGADGTWTDNGSASCSTALRLYCVGQ